MSIVMTLALIVRQIAVAAICFITGAATSMLLIKVAKHTGLNLGPYEGFIGVACVVACWLVYRLFFRHTIVFKQKNGDDVEITM